VFTLNNKLIEVIKGLTPSDEEITDATILENLGFDSLKTVELMVEVEENFDIEFEESDLNTSKIQTVADLENLLKKYS